MENKDNALRLSFLIFRKKVLADNIAESLNCLSITEAFEVLDLVRERYIEKLQGDADKILAEINRINHAKNLTNSSNGNN
jgi:hypothetical protein